MAAGSRRSRRELAAGFGGWLSAADDVPVTAEVTRPSSGLSSETVLVKASSELGTRSLVIRLPPAGETLFPDYDLARQFRVQAALDATAIPVAAALALETDPQWVGAPFLVMPHISGVTLTAAPPYPQAGLLYDAGPDVQRRVLADLAEMLGRINRLDPATLELGELSGGGPTLAGMLDYWDSYLAWCTPDDGSDTTAAALYREALGWLRAHLPPVDAPGLLWGDPQLVNLVLDDELRTVAVLDWEMAATGPAEVDLAWFLVLHEGAAETSGGALPGDPGRAEFIAGYEASLGRPVRDLHWYELFAQLRSGCIVLRIGELMARDGIPNTWTAHVPQLRHTRRLLDTPPGRQAPA